MSDVRVEWHGDDAADKLQRVVEEMLWLAGQDAITQAMNNVPLDTGTLRRSGTVTVEKLPDASAVYSEAQNGSGSRGKTIGKSTPRMGGKTSDRRVFVSYNTPYAIWLHESPDWKPRNWKVTAAGHRVTKPAVGCWKWLEKALPKVKSRWSVYLERAKRKAGIFK